MFFSSFPPETTRRLLSRGRIRASSTSSCPMERARGRGRVPVGAGRDELLVRPRALPRDPRGGEGGRLPLRALRRGPERGDLFLRHDIDLSLDAALAMAELEAELDVRPTYLLMTESVFYNLASSEGARRSRGCASSATRSGSTPSIRTSSLDERFDPVVSWHNPTARVHVRGDPRRDQRLRQRATSRRRRTARTRTSTGGGVPARRASRRCVPVAADPRPPGDLGLPGATMGQTMRAMLEGEKARRLEQLAADDIDLRVSVSAARRPLPREHGRRAVGERPGAPASRRRRAARRLQPLPAPPRGGPVARAARRLRPPAAHPVAGAPRLLPRTDVFHFYFGLTLVPRSVQFPILRALRKKSVMHYLGSDIRGKSPASSPSGRRPARSSWARTTRSAGCPRRR